MVEWTAMRAGRWKVIKQPQAEQQFRQRKALLQFWNGHRVDVLSFIFSVEQSAGG
jgi:hypothetical protein